MANNPFGIIREGEVYTTKTIADLLGVQEKTIRRNLIKAGIVPLQWCRGVYLVSGRKFMLGVDRLIDEIEADGEQFGVDEDES